MPSYEEASTSPSDILDPRQITMTLPGLSSAVVLNPTLVFSSSTSTLSTESTYTTTERLTIAPSTASSPTTSYSTTSAISVKSTISSKSSSIPLSTATAQSSPAEQTAPAAVKSMLQTYIPPTDASTSIHSTTMATSVPPRSTTTTTTSSSLLPTSVPPTPNSPKTTPTYSPPNIPFTYLNPTTLLTIITSPPNSPTLTPPPPPSANHPASSPKLIGLVTAGCFIGTLTLSLLYYLYRRCTYRRRSHLPHTSISLPLSPSRQPLQPSPSPSVSVTETRGVPFFTDNPESVNPFHDSNVSSAHSSDDIGSEGGYQEPEDVRRDRLARLMRRNHSPTPTIRGDREGMSVWVISPWSLNVNPNPNLNPSPGPSPAKSGSTPIGKSPSSTPRSILKAPSSTMPRSILKPLPPPTVKAPLPPILKRASIPAPISTSSANANQTTTANEKGNRRPSLSARILSPIRATRLGTPFRRNVKSFPDMAMQPFWVEMVPATGSTARPGTMAGLGSGTWPGTTAAAITWAGTAVEIQEEVAAVTGIGIDGWASARPGAGPWGTAVSPGMGGWAAVGPGLGGVSGWDVREERSGGWEVRGEGSGGAGGKVKKGVKWGEDQVREFGRTPFASTVNSAAGSVVGDGGDVGDEESGGDRELGGDEDMDGEGEGDVENYREDVGNGDGDRIRAGYGDRAVEGERGGDGAGAGEGGRDGMWGRDDISRSKRSWSPLGQRKD